jgi:hypothetical protein
MKGKLLLGAALLAAIGAYVLQPKPPVPLKDIPGASSGYVPPVVPADWEVTKQQRTAVKAAYLSQHSVAADWFAAFPFSQVDGIPMVVLRLLPVVAPEIWGAPDEFGASFGLFKNTAANALPLPVGIGMSGLEAKRSSDIDYTSFSCGACHIGRVDVGGGATSHIWGGVNAEFNITKFFVDMKRTFDKLAEANPSMERRAAITQALVEQATRMHGEKPDYFYGNAQSAEVNFDAAYEARQVDAFLKDSGAIVGAVVDYIDGFIAAYGTYMDKTYKGYQKQMLDGLPGMADATGVSASHGYESLEATFIGRLFADGVFPTSPGLTDYMLVWEQSSRTARWNEDGTLLVDGGGQYNGNIPIPIYRNLAASMTMGLKDVDLRVAAFAAELLGGLPADPYPFSVNTALAETGRQLFTENCAECHRPNNGTVYRNVGTDVSRSYVINDMLMKGARQEYLGVCGPETTVTLYADPIKPCAEFDSKPITEDAVMRPLEYQHGGYNATALAGIWAAAPYLHTGSVPTIYHLLVPSERPEKFVKSALAYDQTHMGFAWQENASGGYVFDTTAFAAITRAGHDKDISMNGKTYKLDWSDDKDGAMAIIEYLKTL